MNEERTNYGRIIAVTLAVITATATIAFIFYRLARKLISFCHAYRELDDEAFDLDFDELDEALFDDDPKEEIVLDTTCKDEE